ncbi:MAG: DUF1801 domain-containing protein [Saprospiraceae bacterium]|nr:DUF1801 domain-containing protein [Saprospiraceae bacterium]
MKKTVDDFFQSVDPKWLPTLTLLRKLCNQTELMETLKWGMPVYTINNKNVVGIGAFTAHAGLWFYNGSFLRDEAGVLLNAQEGKTKGMRQWRFEEGDEIPDKLVLAYLKEAIENQKQGKEIVADKNKKWPIPSVFQIELDTNPALLEQFNGLTPGRQREYLEYLNEPKMEKTVISRMQKCIPIILEGKGLNDRYKK